MKIYLSIFIISIFILSCDTRENEKRKRFVLPTIVYEGEEVRVNYIEDSVEIKSDSLFFSITIVMQDFSKRRGYVLLKKQTGTFVVPKNAAYLYGYFYTTDDADKNYFYRPIYNANTNKANSNAFSWSTDSLTLFKDLENESDNLVVYASYINSLALKVYTGKVSDSILTKEIENLLPIVEQKANTERVADLYTLGVLYTFHKEYDKAHYIFNQLEDKFPNSNFLSILYDNYNLAKNLDDAFPIYDYSSDSLIARMAKSNPYSPISSNQVNSYFSINNKYFDKEDLIINSKNNLKYKDSTNTDLLELIVLTLIEQGEYIQARKYAQEYLTKMRHGMRQHYTTSSSESIRKVGVVGNEFFVFNAYLLLANVEDSLQNSEKALVFIDSANNYYSTRKRDYNVLQVGLNYKAILQRRSNQYLEALKTYETLYQETKDERVLDSIKVVFKETEQEKGFESYVKNLRERVESESREPKKLAANFSIKDMSGYEIKLSDWKERVVVLNFWANYCLPCAKEIPFLNELWRETQTDEIIFLSVTKNTPLEVTRFAQRQKEMFSFSVLPNAKELTDVYDVNLVPTTIVINKKGEIVHRESGFSGNIDKLKQVVLEELKK